MVLTRREALPASALATALPAAAQAWPTRPIRFVVPWPPGGLNDLIARYFNDRVAVALGVVTLLAWAVAVWLSVGLAVALWLVGAAVIVPMVVFARGALGPRGGGQEGHSSIRLRSRRARASALRARRRLTISPVTTRANHACAAAASYSPPRRHAS